MFLGSGELREESGELGAGVAGGVGVLDICGFIRCYSGGFGFLCINGCVGVVRRGDGSVVLRCDNRTGPVSHRRVARALGQQG